MHETKVQDTDIAVIGMAGRFPKSRDLSEWWKNLCDGRELITFFTDEELKAEGIDAALLADPSFIKAAAVLEDIAGFDADYFGFNPREAEVMDPQQRFFLECAHEALENAGYVPDRYEGRIGVYAGESMNTYLLSNLVRNPAAVEAVGAYQVMIGNDKDFLATQVCYKLNLKGPGITVQTACSTSLVAIHMACQSVLTGECDIAIAGGVSIKSPHKSGYRFREGGIMSPDGHCRAFDASSRGTVDGNGVGVVVLKRLADAIAEGDSIHAVVKGSAINNDGSLKIGYTAPSQDGQAEVIAEALAVARVSPDTIGYVEAHGTGTPLGDPIEIAALTQAWRASTNRTGCCAIGSVKTNMGHLDAAAGVSGFLKTVLCLENKALPPSLHFCSPNPKIHFEKTPFYVNNQLQPWLVNGTLRRAAVSSFGIGGTNAHAVLEEAPSVSPSDDAKPWQLLTISARTETALDAATVNLSKFLRDNASVNLADLAWTLQTGRRMHAFRRAVVARDLEDAVQLLDSQKPDRSITYCREASARQIVFMFPGQGTQYPNMGRELYESESVFRNEVDQCAEWLQAELGFDIREVLFPNEEAISDAAYRLGQTSITQPALFVIEYALARQWMEWGIRPLSMIGHSIGEYVAACLAGVMKREDALSLVAARGRTIQALPPGSMLAVPLAEARVRQLLPPELSIAAVNAAGLTVVSGPSSAVDALEQNVKMQGIECQRLHTSHAFHSAMMEPALDEFRARISRVQLSAPRIPFISNVTGTWITAAQATDSAYWARHIRQTVRFDDGVAEILKQPDRVLLEVGPGHTLASLARPRIRRDDGQTAASSLRAAQQSKEDRQSLLAALGVLWTGGITIDWRKLHGEERRRRIPAPTYPFEHRRYWVEPHTAAARPSNKTVAKKASLDDWFYFPVWHRKPPARVLPKLERDNSAWLFFRDDTGFGQQLVAALRTRGEKVIEVAPSTRFTSIGGSVYFIDPAQAGDYTRLVQSLLEQGDVPCRIVHAWNVTGEQDSGFSDRSQYLGIYSLTFLAQALESLHSEPVRLTIISDGVQEVTGSETIHPAKTTVLAPCVVLIQEYPNFSCRHIDIEISHTEVEQSRLAKECVAEIDIAHGPSFVALRHGVRWARAFEAAAIPNQGGAVPSQLRRNGTYLITGGLGNIGLAIAEYLARTVQANIVLVSRTPLPPFEQWDAISRSGPGGDPVRARIQRIRTVESLGGKLLTLAADVADETAMQDVLTRTHEVFGPVHGVFHAAGVLSGRGFSEIRNTNEATCEIHFGPKARGVLVLDRILRDEPLDFVLLLSSIASLLGGLGYMAYAAGNLFLDGFARAKRLAGDSRWITVNWDAWNFAGTTGTEDSQPVSPQPPGPLMMNAQEGLEALARILALEEVGEIVVSTGDLDLRVAQWVARDGVPEPQPHLELHPRPAVSTAWASPRHDLDRVVAGIWETLLGVEKIGIHDNFFELGGHSLLVTQVLSRVRETFRVNVPLRKLFEEPTVSDLSDCITSLDPKPGRAEKVARALIMVQSMSSQEISQALERKNAAAC